MSKPKCDCVPLCKSCTTNMKIGVKWNNVYYSGRRFSMKYRGLKYYIDQFNGIGIYATLNNVEIYVDGTFDNKQGQTMCLIRHPEDDLKAKIIELEKINIHQ